MLISVPTSLVHALDPDSTSVNTSFITVLPLNQLSGILLPGGTLTGTNRYILATKLWLPGCEMVIWKVSEVTFLVSPFHDDEGMKFN